MFDGERLRKSLPRHECQPASTLCTNQWNGETLQWPEVLQVCVASHDLLNDFRFAYNQRKQRVLDGLSPVEHIASWFEEHPRSRNPDYMKPDSQDMSTKFSNAPMTSRNRTFFQSLTMIWQMQINSKSIRIKLKNVTPRHKQKALLRASIQRSSDAGK